MAEHERDEPITGPEGWDVVERRHRRNLVVGSAATAVLLIAATAAGLAAIMRSSDGVAVSGPNSPSANDGGSAISTGAAGEAPVPGGGDAPGAIVTPTDVPGGGEVPTSAPRPRASGTCVTYRVGDVLWVARLSGTTLSQRSSVLTGATEYHAPSPDGTTVAAIDASGTLVLVDVASGGQRVVGRASRDRPVWSPGSDWVLFTRPAGRMTEIRKVGRGGGPSLFVGVGNSPAIAADGATIAYAEAVSATASSGRLVVLGDGKPPRRIEVSGSPSALAIGNERVWFSTVLVRDTAAAPLVEPGIWSVGLDGAGLRRIVGPPSGTRPFGYGELELSPDGTRLFLAEVGDDRYSRAQVMSAEGSSRTAMSRRRDTYPAGWVVDGKAVLLFEGNVFQGEPSRLLYTTADGRTRRVLMERAHR